MIQYFSPKDPDATYIIALNFENLMAPGDTIQNATWSILSEQGKPDISMSVVSSTDWQNDPIVRQKITGGLAGRTYLHKCVIHTFNGSTLVGAGLMKCVVGGAG